jgi:hypothetical protein
MEQFIAEARNGGMKFEPKVREKFLSFLKSNDCKLLVISLYKGETKASRGFLEGAVMPIYCEYKYNIPRSEKKKSNTRRYLFMKDFNFEVVTDKKGDPVKIPKETSRGEAKDILDRFTEYAVREMCPIPNVELYNVWKKKYKMDYRFENYYAWLDFLGIEVDSMPSDEVFKKLYEKPVAYPTEEVDPTF